MSKPDYLRPVAFKKRKWTSSEQTTYRSEHPSKMRLLTTLFPVPEDLGIPFDKNDIPDFYVETVDGEYVISADRFECLKEEIIRKREERLREYYTEKMAKFSASVEAAITTQGQISARHHMNQDLKKREEEDKKLQALSDE